LKLYLDILKSEYCFYGEIIFIKFIPYITSYKTQYKTYILSHTQIHLSQLRFSLFFPVLINQIIS